MFLKNIFVWFDITSKLDLQTSSKITAHPMIKGSMWVKYEPKLTKRRNKYALDKDCSCNFTLNFTFYLETYFNVTKHSLHKSIIGIREEYICSKDCLVLYDLDP